MPPRVRRVVGRACRRRPTDRGSRRDDACSERTNHPREVVEAALAHVVSDQAEAAYARSDLFERRRHLMDDWASAIEATPQTRSLDQTHYSAASS